MNENKKVLLDVIYKQMSKQIEKRLSELLNKQNLNEPYDKTPVLAATLNDYFEIIKPIGDDLDIKHIWKRYPYRFMSLPIPMLPFDIPKSNLMLSPLIGFLMKPKSSLLVSYEGTFNCDIINNIKDHLSIKPLQPKQNRNNRKKKNQLVNNKKPSYINLNKSRY